MSSSIQAVAHIYDCLIRYVDPFVMKLFETDTTRNTYILALCLKVVTPTWQQLSIFLSTVVKFDALETQKSLYAHVIP